MLQVMFSHVSDMKGATTSVSLVPLAYFNYCNRGPHGCGWERDSKLVP